MKYITTTFLLLFFATNSFSQVFLAGKKPGNGKITTAQNKVTLSNNVLKFSITTDKQKLTQITFENTADKSIINFKGNQLFSLELKNGEIVDNSSFIIKSISKDNNNPKTKSITISLVNQKHNISLNWKAEIGNENNFVHQDFQFASATANIQKFSAAKFNNTLKATVSGQVDGSPIIIKNMFFAIEQPIFKIDSTSNASMNLWVPAPIDDVKNKNFKEKVVFGVSPKDQMRRGFLYYLEKNRARAYKPFLHYNSWFDLSYNADTLKEVDCLDRIKTWGDSLTVKRNVKLDGFLWDSGWDNFDNLWKFNSTLPNGFKNMSALGQQYGASMGVWLSPWGGYDDAVVKRKMGVQKNNPTLENNENGFTLAGPNYYQYFKNVAINFVKNENVRIFKFDGVGAGLNATGPGEKYYKDIEAFLSIINDLHKAEPKTYFSLTVGTWPSPFWLNYGDNIWRGNSDMSFVGKGNKRQRWLNYRDADTYKTIVKRAPLYPMNAVMNHGITIGTKGYPKSLENDSKNIDDDFWAFFASGTSLQEMYINPHKLTSHDWDNLATVINWTRERENILVDTHWIGGDPAKGEVYGFPSWNSIGGILTLRNPSAKAVEYEYNLNQLLEIPENYVGNYRLTNARDKNEQFNISSSAKSSITLKPFEVKVLDARRITVK